MEDVARRYADHHHDRHDPKWGKAYSACINHEFPQMYLGEWMKEHSKPSDFDQLEVVPRSTRKRSDIPPDRWPKPNDSYHTYFGQYDWFSTKYCIDMDPTYGATD